MKAFLFTLLVFAGIGFAQYYRHVQVQTWHLTQRNLETQHQLNRLRYKFDLLRQYTDDLQLELAHVKTP
jgi:hypothetical protein